MLTLAISQDAQLRLQVVGVLAGVVYLLVFVPIYAVRRHRRSVDPRRWLDCYEAAFERAVRRGGEAPGGDLGPVIDFRFHTYEGLLHHFTQREHRLQLPAREAEVLAGLLFVENLRGCLIPYVGVLFVPLLSALELRRVKRAAARAIAAA